MYTALHARSGHHRLERAQEYPRERSPSSGGAPDPYRKDGARRDDGEFLSSIPGISKEDRRCFRRVEGAWEGPRSTPLESTWDIRGNRRLAKAGPASARGDEHS